MKLSSGEKEALIADLQKNQKELEESLEYASYIQQALFPKLKEVKYAFPESFIFFRPRDIVSGDFYWIHRENTRTIIALGDSTGHGVPGAFLSILGISYLDLVISKYNPSTASGVLNYLREFLMKALDQTGKEYEQKDGIDMSLCIINKKTQELQYAGAFNSIYIVRNEELMQLEGNKMPVGVAADFEDAFDNRKFKLLKNDMLYLFSDGFPDQFGGEQGKKYKYPRFRTLLTQCSRHSADKQHEILDTELQAWKGDQAQIDDITILGIRFDH